MSILRTSLISLSLLALPAGAQQHPFVAQNMDAGSLGSDVSVGDFDEDGWPDLVVNALFGAAVAFNDGQGGLPQAFDGLVDLPGIGGLAFSHVADLDGDGHLDIAGSVYPGATLQVLLGDGAGGFPSVTGYAAPQDPGGLTSGDFDGDGDLDLITVGRSVDRARVYENLGAGQFTGAGDHVVGDHCDSVAVGDVDEDGDLDFVSGNRFDGTFSLYLGGPGLAFSAAGVFDIGYNPFNIQLVDLSGDGHLDVLVGTGDIGDDRVTWRRGTGAGGFGPLIELHVGGDYPLDPWVVDLDEDGVLDIVVPSALDEGLYVLEGLGAGAFGPGRYVGTSNNPQGMAVADLDRDGDLDVVVTHVNSDVLTVLRGQGDGSIGDNLPVGLLPRDVAAGDLDGDGRPDLVASTLGDADLWILRQTIAGRFDAAVAVPAGGLTDELELADLDGDGHLDAVVNHPQQTLSSLTGQGDGSFAAPLAAGSVGTPTTPLEDLHLGDLDGDGHPDAVLLGGTASRVLLGRGDGTFGAPLTLPGVSHGLALGDLDGDGDLDVVDQQTGSIQAHLGDGAGGFSRPTVTATTIEFGRRLTLGDVDEDGQLDAVLNGSLNLSEVWLGGGDGGFTFGGAVTQYTYTALTIALADVTRDGHLDLIHGGSWWGTTSGGITYNEGHGDGSFGDPVWVQLGSSPAHGTVVDIDQDGALDLVFAVTEEFGSNGTEAHHVSLLRNRSGAWTQRGAALAGGHGTPSFVSAGPLVGGSTIEHHLDDALPGGTAWFVIGFSDLSAPFKGGLLVPTPDVLVPLPLDGDGRLSIVDTWPNGLPSGVALFYQWWIADPAGPAGWSTSNALEATLP